MRMNCRGRAGSRAFAIPLAALLGVGALASPAGAAVPGTSPQPTISAGNGQITVTFAAPPSNGGKSDHGLHRKLHTERSQQRDLRPSQQHRSGRAHRRPRADERRRVHVQRPRDQRRRDRQRIARLPARRRWCARDTGAAGRHARPRADHRRVQPSRQQRQRDHELHRRAALPRPVCRAATRARCRRS